MELLVVAGVIGIVVVLVVLSPFFVGEGGSLQDASSSDNLSVLASKQESILQRWIKDEAAATSGEISATEWKQRQRYLTSRYVDFAKRMAWLKQMGTAADGNGGKS